MTWDLFMAFIFRLNDIYHQSILSYNSQKYCYDFPASLPLTLRDSNPDRLPNRRIRRPLRNATKAAKLFLRT
jgi:hypothetical protein